jgi:hypothetical protein
MGSVTVSDGAPSLVRGGNEAMPASSTIVGAEFRRQAPLALKDGNVR